jgi:hypothetical protein
MCIDINISFTFEVSKSTDQSILAAIVCSLDVFVFLCVIFVYLFLKKKFK